MHDITTPDQNYRELFSATHDAVLVRDFETGSLVDANPRACEMFGYSLAELRTMRLGDLSSGLPGYTADEARKRFETSAAADAPVFEWHARRRSGEFFWVEFSLGVAPSDEKPRALIIARDVTERRREADALRLLAAGTSATGASFFRDLVTHFGQLLGVAYVLIAERRPDLENMRTRALYAFGTVVENLQYPLRGSPCERVLDRDVCVWVDGVQEEFPDDPWLQEHGIRSYAGVRLVDSTGQMLGVLSALDVKPLECEQHVESLLRIFAGRTAAELERLRIEEAHTASETRYRAIVETTSDIVWESDVRGRCIYCNKAVKSTLGLAPDAVMGRDLAEFVHPDDQPRYRAQFRTAISESCGWTNLVLRWRNRDGSYRHLQSSSTPVYRGDEDIVGFRGIDRDITDRVRADTFRYGQNHALELILSGADLPVILTTLVRNIEAQTDGMLGSVLLLTPDQRLVTGAAPSLPDAYNLAIDGVRIGPFVGSCGTAAFRNERVIVEDISKDPLWADFAKLAHEHDLRSCWSEPIRAQGGAVLGTFALYYHQPRRPAEHELNLIEEAARVCRLAIERTRSEEERRNHTRLLVSLERVDRVIRQTDDLDEMMRGVLDTMIAELDCDRAWLVFPCDPDAPTWRVPMERTRPEYPGAGTQPADLPMTDEARATLAEVSDSGGPVCHGPMYERAVPARLAKRYGIQSEVITKIVPKSGPPWAFGLHQCSHARVWSNADLDLFREAGRRITDALGQMLSHRDVRESRSMLQLVLDAIPARVFWKDRDLRYLGGNHLFARDAGVSHPDEVIGWVDHDFPWRTFADQYRNDDREVIDSGVPKLNYEEPLTTPTGETVWLRTSKIPLRDAAGTVIGVLGAYEDITEQKRVQQAAHAAHSALLERERREKELVEAELARTRESLVRQTRLAAIGQVAASIAHELRNPLGAIRNSAFFLRRRTSGEREDWAHQLGIIEHQAAESDRIISDLLDMTRAKPAKKQSIDLEDVVRESFAAAVDHEHIQLQLEFETRPLLLSADRGQIGQVLRNLFANAAHAMPDGGCVSVAAATRPDGVAITITDTGPGVAPDARDRIFEPLFTSKAKGTGLGLTVCRQIIEQHGGTITLASTSGPGAEFQIRLPRE